MVNSALVCAHLLVSNPLNPTTNIQITSCQYPVACLCAKASDLRTEVGPNPGCHRFDVRGIGQVMPSSVGSEVYETPSPNGAMQVRGISTSCDADKQPQPRRLCQPQDAGHSKRIDPPNACGRYIHKQETSRLLEYTYCGAGVRTDDGVVLKQVRARYVEGNEKTHECSKISK